MAMFSIFKYWNSGIICIMCADTPLIWSYEGPAEGCYNMLEKNTEDVSFSTFMWRNSGSYSDQNQRFVRCYANKLCD